MTAESYVLSTGLATGLDEELVREVASILEFHLSGAGQLAINATYEALRDAAARAVLQARAWELRRAADEAAQERRHREAARETQTILDRAETRRRTREQTEAQEVARRVVTARPQWQECPKCEDKYGPGGEER